MFVEIIRSSKNQTFHTQIPEEWQSEVITGRSDGKAPSLKFVKELHFMESDVDLLTSLTQFIKSRIY